MKKFLFCLNIFLFIVIATETYMLFELQKLAKWREKNAIYYFDKYHDMLKKC
jgi:hypothetical protein